MRITLALVLLIAFASEGLAQAPLDTLAKPAAGLAPNPIGADAEFKKVTVDEQGNPISLRRPPKKNPLAATTEAPAAAANTPAAPTTTTPPPRPSDANDPDLIRSGSDPAEKPGSFALTSLGGFANAAIYVALAGLALGLLALGGAAWCRARIRRLIVEVALTCRSRDSLPEHVAPLVALEGHLARVELRLARGRKPGLDADVLRLVASATLDPYFALLEERLLAPGQRVFPLLRALAGRSMSASSPASPSA